MIKQHLRAVLASYPEIFFLQGSALGVVLLAITLLNPNVALAGIISVLAAYAFARFIRMDSEFLGSGYYTYNPLLVGLSLGYLFKLTPLTAFFVVATGVLTFILTALMASIFLTYFKLPILSLPFVVASSIAYLASLRYSNLLVVAPHNSVALTTDLGLPTWLAGYFKSWGAILFAPSVVVGMLFCLLVLRASRILFFLSLLGYYVGVGVRSLMLGSAPQTFEDIYNFNFILIAMIVGGVFLIPSVSSYVMAVIAVVISIVFLDSITVFWSFYGIPAFALPFNVISLGVIYVLGLMSYPLMAKHIGRTPEETLDNYLANRLRYRGRERTLFLPFSGKWSVWQGFDGQWTHKGSWRYAYDFVITDEQGQTVRGRSNRLEDYYAFRKPVMAPVRGRVVKAIDGVPDNPIGQPDETDNWGNLVMIQDPRGFFVEISHLAEGSLRVKEGEWVERGTVLGLCGNSGYSPQPHIHVQVQETDDLGTGTIPFSFVSYTDGTNYHANDVPDEQQQVEPLYLDRRLDEIMTFRLDDEHEYAVSRDGREVDRLALKVTMAVDGTFCLESDRGRLYFGKHEGTFYFYRIDGRDEWLPWLFMAAPRIPLVHRDKLAWRDYVPVGVATSGPRRMLARLLSSFYPDLAKVQSTQTFRGQSRIETVIESKPLDVCRRAVVELDAKSGFASVTIDGIELKRIDRDAT